MGLANRARVYSANPMKIDPTYHIMLSDKAWPLALPLVDSNGQSIGLAQYESYSDADTERSIFYTFNGKRFKLISKIKDTPDETIDD